MSCSLPNLFIGIELIKASSVPPHVFKPRDIRVLTNPGANALTVMFLVAKSDANFFVNWCTAAFDASYACVGADCGTNPATLPTLITLDGSASSSSIDDDDDDDEQDEACSNIGIQARVR